MNPCVTLPPAPSLLWSVMHGADNDGFRFGHGGANATYRSKSPSPSPSHPVLGVSPQASAVSNPMHHSTCACPKSAPASRKSCLVMWLVRNTGPGVVVDSVDTFTKALLAKITL